jgi:hypothetical protein
LPTSAGRVNGPGIGKGFGYIGVENDNGHLIGDAACVFVASTLGKVVLCAHFVFGDAIAPRLTLGRGRLHIGGAQGAWLSGR